VLLDVIVRHKDMSLDKKLKASDFTITEDGVPQTVKTFRFVGGRDARVLPNTTGSAPAASTGSVSANPLHEPNFVSIVFGDMGPDSRINAILAATDFLEQEFQTNTYAAVFSIGMRINAVHGFTNDRAALTKAVRQAVSGTPMELANASAGVLNETTFSTTAGPGGISTTPNGNPAQMPDLATGGASQAPFSEAQLSIASMISSQRDLVSNVAGMEVMNGLLRLVEYESKLPGRKTVLYLSEGLVKPPNRPDVFRRVISAANRGSISFYCIDVLGLTPQTLNGTAAGLATAAANLGATQGTMSSSPAAAMAQAGEFDQVALSLSSHVQLNMAELAQGTGGFAVFSTNNFKKNMARIMEEVRTHYEISYAPTSTVYDGHFRRIEVTVHDPKLSVQSRDGYFALPDVNGVSVLPYEMEGLRALQNQTRRDFEFRAAAFRFQPLGDRFRYEMAFDLDTSLLTTHADPTTHTVRIHGTFLALIKDSSGQIAAKVSQEVDREVPESKIDQFRRGRIVFTAPFEVTPGRYTVEAAVTDPEGNRSSTKRISLVVPIPGGPAMSSVALVREIDPLTAPRDPGNPLEFHGGKIIPSLAQTNPLGADTALFFVVYPGPAGEKPKVTISFFRDGTEVSRIQPDPGSPDEVRSLPIIAAAKLPAGNYLARVTVEQGAKATHESLAVSVEERDEP
jgi:VWFA-related protein